MNTSFLPSAQPVLSGTVESPIQKITELSWQSQLALLVSTLLGLVLVVILSPLLLIAGIWLAWTRLTEFLTHSQRKPSP